ncbi:MAG: hypothetical protein JO076_11095 [Verrucomicrobia bacterium]|nr:hypothetical protein [Verrucomicrobiota bacterium]
MSLTFVLRALTFGNFLARKLHAADQGTGRWLNQLIAQHFGQSGHVIIQHNEVTPVTHRSCTNGTR